MTNKNYKNKYFELHLLNMNSENNKGNKGLKVNN